MSLCRTFTTALRGNELSDLSHGGQYYNAGRGCGDKMGHFSGSSRPEIVRRELTIVYYSGHMLIKGSKESFTDLTYILYLYITLGELIYRHDLIRA